MKAAVTAEPNETKRGLSPQRFALVLLAISFSRFTTALAFGHPVLKALGEFASDLVLLVAAVSALACVRSRKRRKAPNRTRRRP